MWGNFKSYKTIYATVRTVKVYVLEANNIQEFYSSDRKIIDYVK